MAIIADQRHHLIQANWRWRLFVFVAALAVLAFIGASFFLLHSIGWFWVLLIDAAMISTGTDQFRIRRKRVELAIEADCQEALSDFIAQEEVVRHTLAAAETRYRQECTSYKSYPPDWEWRRQMVLTRDEYHCTNCGWPQGFLRRTRELHIHHVKLLARDGDNSLDNLITLCHICHRDVDVYHSRVQKNTKQNRRRRLGL